MARLTELDLGVYRVGRRDGPDWVARVFAADRPLAAAEGDAALLRRLEQQEFPAERCAAQEPVSVHEGQGVLVTRYVPGTRADGSRREPSAGWVACSAGCTCCPPTMPGTAEAGIT